MTLARAAHLSIKLDQSKVMTFYKPIHFFRYLKYLINTDQISEELYHGKQLHLGYNYHHKPIFLTPSQRIVSSLPKPLWQA